MMYAKIEITGVIEVVTGMHIGGYSKFAAIGAIDSPVIRDILTDDPMIPGSSLKGKMRSLLAKQYNEKNMIVHTPDEDDSRIVRLFGSAQTKKPKRSRLLFSDMVLCNKDELKKIGIESATEIKLENTIDRLTAVANPRQIERAIRGSRYMLQMIYDVENEQDIEDDFKMISEGFKLLQYDYIGGSGSRGYGKVKFNNLDAAVVIGTIDDAVIDHCRNTLKEV